MRRAIGKSMRYILGMIGVRRVVRGVSRAGRASSGLPRRRDHSPSVITTASTPGSNSPTRSRGHRPR